MQRFKYEILDSNGNYLGKCLAYDSNRALIFGKSKFTTAASVRAVKK